MLQRGSMESVEAILLKSQLLCHVVRVTHDRNYQKRTCMVNKQNWKTKLWQAETALQGCVKNVIEDS